jgi:hypothetical protein
MTESEWLKCSDPKPTLEFLRGKVSDRKLRLFACGCCRLVLHTLIDDRSKHAVEVSERFADGEATEAERQRAERGANAARSNQDDPHFHATDAVWDTIKAVPNFLDAMDALACDAAMDTKDDTAFEAMYAAMSARLATILRDIFGNPFRTVTADPKWLTPNVIALAHTIYNERAFDRMSELAATLEQAGCTDANILAHCRQSGDHVRGCWVIDLLLGKE